MRLAILGDVHLRFDAVDVARLDARGYDAVLFVGDLAGYAHRGGLKVARTIATLRTPALVIPGNHDGVTGAQLLSELVQNDRTSTVLALGMTRRVRQLREALGPAILAGYSRHTLRGSDGTALDCIAARPHSFGGPHLAFRSYLRRTFDVDSLERSAARLRALVDESTAPLVFFAHNGPTGLGDQRDSIWGADFRPRAGDHGDPDLRDAIEHARATGKRVVAIVAGHMHHRVRGGGQRTWLVREGETLFVNAARVPRIGRHESRVVRHWVELDVDGERAEAREILEDV